MRRAFRIAIDAYWRFNADDGWAVASNIALSALMALFPFLIVLTSLAVTFGSSDLAEKVVELMLATWPEEVARPISDEIHNVLRPRRDLFTLGLIFAIYFSSSGIESLRIGLNRAYGMVETRNWLMLRLESICYVVLGAAAMLALGFLIVLGPLLFRMALAHAPWLEPLEGTFTFFRFGIATVVLVIALVVAHKWLPAGHRRMVEILPGIVVTLLLWLLAGVRLRTLSRRVLVDLCGLLQGPRLGHDRADVPVLDGIDLRLRRRAQRGDLPGAGGARAGAVA